MQSLIHSAFSAIFLNEVRLNSKRVAPYAMVILFGGNALLWWGWGPAAGRGWAINSDAFIAGVLPVFSFMTLPLFTALIMADPVIRDFRTGVAPLIFSKPISRAEYLIGKFCGNFFVLVCCQSAFVLTLFVLQAFSRPGMVVQEVRAIPYLKHFLVFVVISHLVLAAIYFTVGTLTRNAKIVYGLGFSFYPVYIAYQTVVLKSLSLRWRSVLDPLLMNWGDKTSRGHSAEVINQLVIVYDSNLIANRLMMILIAVICLSILLARFVTVERAGNPEKFSALNLSSSNEVIFLSSASTIAIRDDGPNDLSRLLKKETLRIVPLPETDKTNTGIRSHVNKLMSALGLEFRLLRTERSLVVILPLAVLLAFLSLPFQATTSGETYSASFATSTANGILIFLLGVIVFYTGEGMHRDREMRIEPFLWAAPVTNSVLLLSKFLITIALALVVLVLAGLTAITTQFLRGLTPVEISAYVFTYSLILLPTVFFMTAASISLNVLLRDKYLTYAVSIATGGGLFYLYSQGHNHWLYNPALFQLWTYADLVGAANKYGVILMHRVYCLALGGIFLALAHFFFERRASTGIITNRRLLGNGWSILITIMLAAIALVAGLMIDSKL